MTDKTIQFIDRAKAIHGDKYDYSDVEYVNARTKVRIRCKKHGIFEQTPDKHIGIYRCGCPICAGNRQGSAEAFKAKAVEVHGDLYDYSRVVYKNNREPVEIVCEVHGSFWQSPSNHLAGKGCKKCANNVRLTAAEFITKAKAVHGDFYDYSEVVYDGNRNEVVIVCPEHGPFMQIPYVHLAGCGCPVCGFARRTAERDEIVIRQKARETCMEKYGVPNPMMVDAIRQKQHAAVASDEVNEKRIATKRRNNSFNTSLCEDRLYRKLVEEFGDADVVHGYSSEQYPFQCDFYIRSMDLYIELNVHWSHGGHWYSNMDAETVSMWRRKPKYYVNAAETFSVRDVVKRDAARKAGLNYVVFWKQDLSDAEMWFRLGCPAGHDWECEYSWMK